MSGAAEPLVTVTLGLPNHRDIFYRVCYDYISGTRTLERYSREVKDAVRAMRASGATYKQIETALGVSRQTAHRWASPIAEETQALYREKNTERIQEYKKSYMKAYRLINKDCPIAKAKDAERWQRRYQRIKTDPVYREAYLAKRREQVNKRWARIRAEEPAKLIPKRLRSRIRKLVKEGKGKKSERTMVLLGCTADELISRWDQCYTPAWRKDKNLHIDHIRPCASFDLENEQQQYVCFNWRNLQLLSKEANLAKGCSWTPEMEAEWMRMMRENGFDGELFPVFH